MAKFSIFDDENSSSVENNARAFVLALVVAAVFFIYVLKLFSLQIISGSSYRNSSERISNRVKEIPAQRGEIFDRNAAMPLVINTDSFAVDLTPAEIPPGFYDSITLRLASFLGISKAEIDRKVEPSLRKSYTAVEVKANVPFNVISNIAENLTDLPGVSWRSKPVRNYVESGSSSHFLGYVGNITKEEYKVMYNQGYKSNDVVGKTGIEKQYDKFLQGSPGIESRIVDARGHILSDKPHIQPPTMGNMMAL